MASADTRTMVMEVFRYLPDEADAPRFDKFEVPYQEDWVVLDAINWVKDNVDGSLSYRWSCRMGVCGSCGMVVNGEPSLTCSTFLRDYYPNPIRVEPLEHFPVVRDLVINMESFLENISSLKTWLIPKEERSLDDGEYRQSPAELAQFKQYSMCINCMICYSACPVVGLNATFMGPAALALAQRYNLDSRDGGVDERAHEVSSDHGIWDCTFVGECSRVCPKDVDPAGAIQQAKASNTLDWYKSKLMPGGKR